MKLSSARPYSLSAFINLVRTKLTRTELGGNKKYCLMQEGMRLNTLPEHTVILRFDVERDLRHHLKVAELLAASDIPCTMYFHTRKECYHPPTLKRIQDTGCEVGYHHECLDRCGGDFERARELFLKEVEMFRKDDINIQTVCSHGELGIQKNGYRANSDLIRRYPSLLKDSGLVGEVFDHTWQSAPVYASDTFKKYDKFWQMLTAAGESPKPMIVTVHLHRWRRNPIASAWEIGQDILRFVINRTLGKRRYNVVTHPM